KLKNTKAICNDVLKYFFVNFRCPSLQLLRFFFHEQLNATNKIVCKLESLMW
ncbi:hypothetical protein, partial [Mycoplasma phage sp.]